MTQQVCKARLILPSTDPLTDNTSINLVLEATGSDTTLDFTDSEAPQSVLANFINATATGQAHPLSYYLSPVLSRAANAFSIEWTDITAHLDGSPAGSPFRTDTFTLGAAGNTLALPSQDAAAAAMRADYGTAIEHGPSASLPSSDSAIDQGAPATHTGNTRPRARLRSRVFIGPLNGAAINDANGVLADAFVSDLEFALNGLIQTHNAISHNQFNIVAWSRRGAEVNPCTFYYVSPGFAAQRRRGDTDTVRVHSWTARS